MKLIMLSVAFEIVSRIALAQGAAEGWIVSETTSPVDYAPIVTATVLARGNADGALRQLSVHCRSGRTEMVVGGPAASESGADYALSYRLADNQPVQVAAGKPSFGTGVAFRGDVVGLLLSLPSEGGIAIRLASRAGAVHDGYFSLVGLKTARDRVAAACRWPSTLARPRSE